jgi:C-terminal processing protease CtpA/Prc
MLNPSIGYLRLTSFSDYTDSGLFADALKELETALD